MAESLVKYDSNVGGFSNANTGDSDGSLVTALVEVLTPSTSVGFRLVPFELDQSGSPSGLANGHLFRSDAVSGTDSLFFQQGGVSREVVLAGIYSFVGDVTGTPGATVVEALQGDDINPGISPSDGQVLTWVDVDSRWDASDPAGGGLDGFSVLDSTATAADVDTELAKSDVFTVYLKPGSYTWSGSEVDIPAGKALIGLGHMEHNGSSGVVIDYTTTSTYNIDLGDGAYLANMRLVFNASSTGDMITDSGTGGVVEYVDVYSASDIAYQAFDGSFKRIANCYIENCLGIALAAPAAPIYTNGPQEITNVYMDGHSTSTSALNSIQVAADFVSVQNVVVTNAAYAIYATTADDLRMSKVRSEACRIGGINLNVSHRSTISDVWVKGTNGTNSENGFYLDGDYNVVTGVYAYQCSSVNSIYFLNCNDGVFSNIGAYDCGQSSTTNDAFRIQACDQNAFSNLYASNTGGDGIYIRDCNNCAFTGLNSYLSGNIGIQSYNNDYCTFTGLEVRDSTSHGIYSYSTDSTLYTSIRVHSNSGDGIRTQNTSTGCMFVGVIAQGNAGDGIEIQASAMNAFTLMSIHTINQTTASTYGVRGGAGAGTYNNTLHGHVSHNDTNNRTLGANWNSADVW